MAFKVGMVGLEMHASYLLAGIEQSDKLDLVGYVGKEEQRPHLEKLQPKKGLPIYPTLEALLSEQDPDIVGISIISKDQGHQAVKALKAGKHVITDKPLLTTREDLDSVKAELGRNGDLRLSMLLTLRASPQYTELRNAVQEGRIGDVVNCYAKRSATLRPEIRPFWAFRYDLSGGPILDLVIHDIDAVRWITGLEFVSTAGHQANVDGHARGTFYDQSQSLFVMSNGASLAVEGHRNVAPTVRGMDSRMTIVGTKGHLDLDMRGHVFQYLQDTSGEITDLPKVDHLVADFANCLESGKDPILTTADVITAMEVCLAGKEACETGKWVKIA